MKNQNSEEQDQYDNIEEICRNCIHWIGKGHYTNFCLDKNCNTDDEYSCDEWEWK